MKNYFGFLLLFISINSLAQTEVGRIDIPLDAENVQMEDFFETAVPSVPHGPYVPGYSLRMDMTSYTEGDCDPTAPAGAAGSCSEPRDVEMDVLIRADLIPGVPKLSKWSNNLKIAKKLFDFKIITAEKGTNRLQLVVSKKDALFPVPTSLLQLMQTDLPSFNYCNGYNMVTGSTVNGSCSNGIVRAYDLQTGAMVSGTCQANGTFYGYELGTGANVYGSCQ